MKALSIRQPWAWLILHAGKDIENRTWHTRERGRILIHAAQGMTREEYQVSVIWAQATYRYRHGAELVMPRFEQLPRGGVVGEVELVDCVPEHGSPWFTGPFGFVLKDPKELPFAPGPGSLGFFEWGKVARRSGQGDLKF